MGRSSAARGLEPRDATSMVGAGIVSRCVERIIDRFPTMGLRSENVAAALIGRCRANPSPCPASVVI